MKILFKRGPTGTLVKLGDDLVGLARLTPGEHDRPPIGVLIGAIKATIRLPKEDWKVYVREKLWEKESQAIVLPDNIVAKLMFLKMVYALLKDHEVDRLGRWLETAADHLWQEWINEIPRQSVPVERVDG